jgi:hypothetical protein
MPSDTRKRNPVNKFSEDHEERVKQLIDLARESGNKPQKELLKLLGRKSKNTFHEWRENGLTLQSFVELITLSFMNHLFAEWEIRHDKNIAYYEDDLIEVAIQSTRSMSDALIAGVKVVTDPNNSRRSFDIRDAYERGYDFYIEASFFDLSSEGSIASVDFFDFEERDKGKLKVETSYNFSNSKGEWIATKDPMTSMSEEGYRKGLGTIQRKRYDNTHSVGTPENEANPEDTSQYKEFKFNKPLSLKEKLDQLKEARDAELITLDQYNSKKRDIVEKF